MAWINGQSPGLMFLNRSFQIEVKWHSCTFWTGAKFVPGEGFVYAGKRPGDSVVRWRLLDEFLELTAP